LYPPGGTYAGARAWCRNAFWDNPVPAEAIVGLFAGKLWVRGAAGDGVRLSGASFRSATASGGIGDDVWPEVAGASRTRTRRHA